MRIVTSEIAKLVGLKVLHKGKVVTVHDWKEASWSGASWSCTKKYGLVKDDVFSEKGEER